MALDTANKRASVLGLIAGLALTLPIPDNVVDQSDRQQVAFSYAGVSAQAAVVADSDYIIVVRADVGTINVRPA